jgi:hypothetical protein
MNIYLNEYGFFPSYLLQNILSYLRINETIKGKKNIGYFKKPLQILENNRSYSPNNLNLLIINS